ncbi:hypothetical protein AOL_s00110g271 [Orbilia oligospora ATCC 24927]|uniref:Uncharacterized protein n=1 Tax=Arthrobotrys oligospora (strain ATCC 24927 / CBS 115.81 / DSM 1491) TaxID=756982 RepID=G1XLA1_ARTOA|nr:hypothetical protein AOL_s00110g271 [Orbilia oligospora ATCC 24927]EGX46107.1 hypothetical protein AOL_s00110g271 [Orbilia oligospora ATCC 24927]
MQYYFLVLLLLTNPSLSQLGKKPQTQSPPSQNPQPDNINNPQQLPPNSTPATNTNADTNTNAAPLGTYVVTSGPRTPTHDFIVPLSTWKTWAIKNRPRLRNLGDEIDFFGEVRNLSCPLGPKPDAINQNFNLNTNDLFLENVPADTPPPRNSLSFLFNSLKHLTKGFKKEVLDVVPERPNPPPSRGSNNINESEETILNSSNFAHLVSSFGLIPRPTFKSRAETILIALIHIYQTFYSFYNLYSELGRVLSNPTLPQPIDYKLYPGREDEVYLDREPIVLDWATTTLIGLPPVKKTRNEPPDTDPEKRRITVDLVEQRKRMVELAKYLNAMKAATDGVQEFRALAFEGNMEYPGFSELLKPWEEYDPEFFDRPTVDAQGNPIRVDFGVADLLDGFEAWFGCWQIPYFKLLKRMLEIEHFPGVEGGLVSKLNEGKPTIEDNGYGMELLRLALLERGIRHFGGENVGEGNWNTPLNFGGVDERLVKEEEGRAVSFQDYDFERDIQGYKSPNTDNVNINNMNIEGGTGDLQVQGRMEEEPNEGVLGDPEAGGGGEGGGRGGGGSDGDSPITEDNQLEVPDFDPLDFRIHIPSFDGPQFFEEGVRMEEEEEDY